MSFNGLQAVTQKQSNSPTSSGFIAAQNFYPNNTASYPLMVPAQNYLCTNCNRTHPMGLNPQAQAPTIYHMNTEQQMPMCPRHQQQFTKTNIPSNNLSHVQSPMQQPYFVQSYGYPNQAMQMNAYPGMQQWYQH